jgi:aminopeptidase N
METEHAGGNVTTDEFIALAESISGQDLGALFETWLFRPGKPVLSAAAQRSSASLGAAPQAPAVARSQIARYGAGNAFASSR